MVGLGRTGLNRKRKKKERKEEKKKGKGKREIRREKIENKK